MTEWKQFWEEYRNDLASKEESLFYQVGKTINKLPIDDSTFQLLIKDIIDTLKIESNDIILEYCCGNGIITYPIASHAKHIYAFDFTERLIEMACQFKQKSNIEYFAGNAISAPKDVFNMKCGIPNKFLMNDSLAYFKPDELLIIINNIKKISSSFSFYITGIPNDEQKWEFYNTPERKEKYNQNQLNNNDTNDGLGRWWNPLEIKKIANQLNLEVSIVNQPVHVSSYRMNVLFSS